MSDEREGCGVWHAWGQGQVPLWEKVKTFQLLLHVDAISHSEVFTYLHSSSSRWKSAVGFLLMRLRQPLLSMYSMLCQVIPSALYSSCRRTHKRWGLVNSKILNVSKATGLGWSRWLWLSTPLDKSWGFRPVDCLSLSSCTGIIGDLVTLETTAAFWSEKPQSEGVYVLPRGQVRCITQRQNTNPEPAACSKKPKQNWEIKWKE